MATASVSLLTLLVMAAPGADTPGSPADLERQLLVVAKDLIKEFQARGHTTVGVLKFQVCKDGKTLSDNVGTLNLLLARRLEVALVLANNPRRPINIIDNASAVAHRTPARNRAGSEGASNCSR